MLESISLAILLVALIFSLPDQSVSNTLKKVSGLFVACLAIYFESPTLALFLVVNNTYTFFLLKIESRSVRIAL